MSAPERLLSAAAPLPSEVERPTFSAAGLVHWLVVDVISGVAFQNGQADEAAWLHDLPNPETAEGPSGLSAVLTRVRDETAARWIRVRNETREARRLEPKLAFELPSLVAGSIESARVAGLWVAGVREAAAIADLAFATAAERNRLEVMNGIPVSENAGWVATWLDFVCFDLWAHARETTRIPLMGVGESDEGGFVVGGAARWWPDDAAEATRRA